MRVFIVAAIALSAIAAPAYSADYNLLSLKLIEGPKTASTCDKYWRIRVYTTDPSVLHVEGGTLLKADFKPDVGPFSKKFTTRDSSGTVAWELYGDTSSKTIGIRGEFCEWTATY